MNIIIKKNKYSYMRTEFEINERMQEISKNLLLIEERIQAELKGDYKKRLPRTMWFLDKEREVWRFALSEMNWILSNE